MGIYTTKTAFITFPLLGKVMKIPLIQIETGHEITNNKPSYLPNNKEISHEPRKGDELI